MNDNPLAQHGKIAYIEIPAVDATTLAAFYAAVFGFTVRDGTAERVSFEDGPSHLIGAFTRRRAVSADGVMPWIYVASMHEALERICVQGGTVIESPHPEGDPLLASFQDPAGNLIGVWQFINPS